MTVRDQIVEFLRSPEQFARAAGDGAVWLDGLQFAETAIADARADPLRVAQVAAWRGLAEARAGLVLGPPGTGKTHLLSWLILGYAQARAAAGLPCRVLVSGFTLNSIGNLLGGVAKRRDSHWAGDLEVSFLGGAPSAGLDPGIRHVERLDGKNINAAVDALEPPHVVVGASIWSVYRLLDSRLGPQADGLTAEFFDLVCIDEASQMVLGHGLLAMGGMKPGARLVVAGDDRQLPPIRASREVKLGDRELGGSLYSFLKSGKVPEFALDETFRLNGPLAAFPEKKFYPGQYRSVHETKQLELTPNWRDGLTPLEETVLDPAWPICVLVHDGPPTASNNPLEARLVADFAEKLAERLPSARHDGTWSADLWTERLAIVSPHRAQNALIRDSLSEGLRRGAFVETVDRIQGKERDAVILSYCVSDSEFAVAEGEFTRLGQPALLDRDLAERRNLLA